MEALMGGHNLEPAADEDQKNLQEQRDEKYGHSPPVLRHHSSLEMYQDETQLNFSFDWDQRILLGQSCRFGIMCPLGTSEF